MTKRIMTVLIVFFVMLTAGMVTVGLALNKEDQEPVRSMPRSGDAAPVSSYPRRQLDERSGALYDALYNGIRKHKEQITLPDTYKRFEYEKIYLMVSMQEPELFALDTLYETGELMQTATIHYAAEKGETERMREEMEQKADAIIAKLREGMTDTQKLMVIHDEIAALCTYREPHGMPDSAYTALVLGTARCEGYAKAFAYVCRRAGLDAMLVTGKSMRGENHVWNKANFDGAYYNVDVTWDDDDSYNGQIVHSCFGMPDAQFGDHLPDYFGYVPPPSGMNTAQTFYSQRGLQVRDTQTFSAKIREWINQAGGGALEFQCADTFTFDSVNHVLRSDTSLLRGTAAAPGTGYRMILTDECRQVIVII